MVETRYIYNLIKIKIPSSFYKITGRYLYLSYPFVATPIYFFKIFVSISQLPLTRLLTSSIVVPGASPISIKNSRRCSSLSCAFIPANLSCGIGSLMNHSPSCQMHSFLFFSPSGFMSFVIYI